MDKPHGQDIRVTDHSGVYLDEPPFSLRGHELLLEIPLWKGETLKTYLVDLSRTQRPGP